MNYEEMIDQEMKQDLLDIIQEQFEQQVLKLFDEIWLKIVIFVYQVTYNII